MSKTEKSPVEKVLAEINMLKEELDGKYSAELSALRTRAAIGEAKRRLAVAAATRSARIRAENDEMIARERDLLSRPKSELLVLERGKSLRKGGEPKAPKAKAPKAPKAPKAKAPKAPKDKAPKDKADVPKAA